RVLSRQECVTVRRRFRDQLRADTGVAAGTILNNDGLSPAFVQLLCHDADVDVSWPTGRQWNYYPDGPSWIVLHRCSTVLRPRRCARGDDKKHAYTDHRAIPKIVPHFPPHALSGFRSDLPRV